MKTELEIKKEAYLNMLKLMPMGVLGKFAQSLFDDINWTKSGNNDTELILSLATELLTKYFPEFKLEYNCSA